MGGKASGQIVVVQGHVIKTSGLPVEGAKVYLWQTDAVGLYWIHAFSRRQYDPFDLRIQGDPNFTYLGKADVAADGCYQFRTVRPIPYPGRSSHIHLAVAVADKPRLFTEVHFADDMTLCADFVLIASGGNNSPLVVTPSRTLYRWPGELATEVELVTFPLVIE